MTITGAAISIYVSLLPDSYVVIKGKFEQWRMKWINAEASKRPNTAVTALDDVGIFFPNISILLHILATLASSLQAERVFSTTDRTLTAFRSTMTELRLEAPVLLNRRPGPQGLLPLANADGLSTFDGIDGVAHKSVSSYLHNQKPCIPNQKPWKRPCTS